MSNNSDLAIYLLSIRGTLAAPTLEQAREVHNATAGAPANVAAAQGLGDISHMVYTPLGAQAQAGEFLILDQWTSLEGLNQFFANPQVQHQAGQIFSGRDPVVWAPAEGLFSYHCPAPFGRNERLVGLVRGRVASRETARACHNELVAGALSIGRRRGNLSHEAFFRLAPPDSPEALEFLAVDVWIDATGMNEQYHDPKFLAGFQQLFVGQPTADVWMHPAGAWVEW